MASEHPELEAALAADTGLSAKLIKRRWNAGKRGAALTAPSMPRQVSVRLGAKASPWSKYPACVSESRRDR